MKIAIPTRNHKVDDHFGHCEYYTIFEIDKKRSLVGQKQFDSPPGCGCKSNIIPLLVEEGVSVMLAGNMGDGALHNLTASGITVVRGCFGNILDVFDTWLNGEVKDSGIGCQSPHECTH
jgi:predicted Fe-Mo cluster-binding NifX family protein